MKADKIGALLTKHLDTWGERDPEKRKISIKKIYTGNVKVIDPFSEITGRESLNDFIVDLQNKHPGYYFTVSKPPDSHHNIASIHWQLGPVTKPDTITGRMCLWSVKTG